MTKKLITAWTPAEPNPPYINFSEDVDGKVIVYGRERASEGEQFGKDFMVAIPKADFAKMIMEAGTTWLFPVKRYRPRTRKPLGER
jgi:hypothetical protein